MAITQTPLFPCGDEFIVTEMHPLLDVASSVERTERIPDISIIIPVLNESRRIVAFLESLQRLRAMGAEVVVVDGGSTDDTVRLAAGYADSVLTGRCGRGVQMNAGAATANGRVLLFLHADTDLPPTAFDAIGRACRNGAVWGRFDVKIEGTSRGLDMVAFMMNWRSRWSGIATGDQAIFVTRGAFDRAGGFPGIPLMEDLVLSRRMRAISRPVCLREKVTTSGRRWDKHGLLRTICTMWWLRLKFHFGASPDDLAQEYGYAPREH
ncbi:MAG: TIGR04283 family arsenosugar biosynthesis glycosyltransferase [Sterolibacterium sp.]|jgi:rSAM/selenodomain-associated transferase 2